MFAIDAIQCECGRRLVAHEGRGQAASTWPFDVGTYLRFSLYVAVGVGSWLGAAPVERLFDTALD